MSFKRIFRIFWKDVRLGPRSPIFLFVIVMPAILTAVVQLVFGSLFTPKPRLGIVDMGNSEISVLAEELEGFQVTMVGNEGELKRKVEDNNLDAGLILPADFDEQVQAGEKPKLEFFMGGETLASNRIILSVTTLELVRTVAGETAPVEVAVKTAFEEENFTVAERMVPFLAFFALIITGIFFTGFAIQQERERRTIWAVLVTPTGMGEFLTAKGMLGMIISALMSVATLALNGALGGDPPALILSLVLGAIMFVEIGLIFGILAKDSATLFTLMKSTGIFFMAPAFFILFPDWPQWIAKIFPTYWIMDPIFGVTMRGETLSSVGFELLIALGICLVLIPVIGLISMPRGSRHRVAVAK
ncbi:MAG: ABC transporter permease [Actinobacteria bacterium]|nr:ABC transporter permease [Actinomycetota bacterium]